MVDEGAYKEPVQIINMRELQTDLDLKYEDQTLAVYPANLAAHPYPFPAPMDREAGIQAQQEMITAVEYKDRLAKGETEGLAHKYKAPEGPSPVLRLNLAKVEETAHAVNKYEFESIDGSPLPEFEAGAHLDVVVAPEYFRQYSLAGDPADRSRYQLGVLREDERQGGSALLHRIFTEGRKVFVSRPINHFPLEEDAKRSFLMGGGIGITPMMAMGHRLPS